MPVGGFERRETYPFCTAAGVVGEPDLGDGSNCHEELQKLGDHSRVRGGALRTSASSPRVEVIVVHPRTSGAPPPHSSVLMAAAREGAGRHRPHSNINYALLVLIRTPRGNRMLMHVAAIDLMQVCRRAMRLSCEVVHPCAI